MIEQKEVDNYISSLEMAKKIIDQQTKTIESLKNENIELNATLDDNNLWIKNTTQLEKENADLKEQLENRLELQRDGQSITIGQQAKTIEELNKTIYVAHGLLNGKEKEIIRDLLKLQDMQNECDTCIRQDCEVAGLEKENIYLKSQLTNQKFLNRQEVEEICYNDFFQRDIDGMVTAILNLAIPSKEIDEKKIIEVLDIYGMEFDSQEVTSESVATEIINSLNGKNEVRE